MKPASLLDVMRFTLPAFFIAMASLPAPLDPLRPPPPRLVLPLLPLDCFFSLCRAILMCYVLCAMCYVLCCRKEAEPQRKVATEGLT